MPERQRGEVPMVLASMFPAVEAAARAIHGGKGCTCRAGARGDARAALDAACDPALGDQRLVPLAAVLDALREDIEAAAAGWRDSSASGKRRLQEYRAGHLTAIAVLARTFGGEPDER